MTETQILKDELKEVGELNSVLLDERQEHKAKLPKRAGQKMVINSPTPYFVTRSCPSKL
jgi:hypothetical protein